MRPEAAPVLFLALALALAGPAAAEKKAKPRPELTYSGRSNVMLAQSYLADGRIEAAEARAKAALQTDGNHALAHATMALVRAAQKQDDKARAEFKRALALDPYDGAVLNAHGSFLCATGDYAGAEAAFLRALEDRRAAQLQPLANAGLCAIKAQEWLKAEGYLRRALALAPTNRMILLAMAELQLTMRSPLEARAFVQRSEALGPDARTLAIAVRVEDAAGDAVSAARYRKRLAEQFPNYRPTAEGGRKQ